MDFRIEYPDLLLSGTTTDLVPQLLGMFDELARRDDGYSEHMVLPSSCGIPPALQKRLSLVPAAQRGSLFGQLCTNSDLTKPTHQEDTKTDEKVASATDSTMLETIIPESVMLLENERNGGPIEEKPSYRRESSGLTPLRYYPMTICLLYFRDSLTSFLKAYLFPQTVFTIVSICMFFFSFFFLSYRCDAIT